MTEIVVSDLQLYRVTRSDSSKNGGKHHLACYCNGGWVRHLLSGLLFSVHII